MKIVENLAWNNPIDKSAKNIGSSIAALKRVRQFVPPSTLLCIYNALIQLHFDYRSVVRGNSSLKLSDKLQKLQNRAARVLTYSSFDTDASLLVESLGWKNLSTQRNLQKALLVYTLPRLRLQTFVSFYHAQTIYHSGTVLWNSLPHNVRKAESLSEFRTVLNIYLK